MKAVTTLFSGSKLNFSDIEFKGGKYNVIFGGVECDLSNAVFTEDCTIKVKSFFGGIKVLVPPGVNVRVNSYCVFGGVSNKQHRNFRDNEITVNIECFCMCGSIAVK